MNLTENDIIFIKGLIDASNRNKENDDKIALNVSKALLSDELLRLFDIQPNSTGGWFFNVYVEFIPLFQHVPAKDWQK